LAAAEFCVLLVALFAGWWNAQAIAGSGLFTHEAAIILKSSKEIILTTLQERGNGGNDIFWTKVHLGNDSWTKVWRFRRSHRVKSLAQRNALIYTRDQRIKLPTETL